MKAKQGQPRRRGAARGCRRAPRGYHRSGGIGFVIANPNPLARLKASFDDQAALDGAGMPLDAFGKALDAPIKARALRGTLLMQVSEKKRGPISRWAAAKAPAWPPCIRQWFAFCRQSFRQRRPVVFALAAQRRLLGWPSPILL